MKAQSIVCQSTGVNRLLTSRFEAVADQFPENVALTFDTSNITYRSLNEKANQLAHYLMASGVAVGDKVGLFLERGTDLIVSILGILKSGACYVPIDPKLPKQRINFLLEDAKITTLLTDDKLLNRLGQSVERKVRLDLDWPHIEKQPLSNLDVDISDEDVAYIIYTSGTTGKPKGVAIPHKNVIELLSATDFYNFSSDDVWTLFHSTSFDFSVWEIWGALAHGGRLVIVPYWVSRSFEDYYQLLRDESVTVLNQTPTAFYELDKIDSAHSRRFKALRHIIFGGEALQYKKLSSWIKSYPLTNVKLHNMFGITETTIHSTYHQIMEQDVQDNVDNIGSVLAHQRLMILDEDLKLVESGQEGEICISGSLAKEYVNNPTLTAERFVYLASIDDVVYRSGDLGVQINEYEYAYRGRKDKQVKVRGYRIELNEINTVIEQHDAVENAVVELQATESGAGNILAYVVLNKEKSLSTGALKEWLSKRLPDYMVPARVVVVDDIPLTPNGKADFKTLRREVEEASLERAIVKPSTQTGRRLSLIVADMLSTEVISMDDNFFDIGGHSLLAFDLLSQIKQVFGIELSVIDLMTLNFQQLETKLEGESVWV